MKKNAKIVLSLILLIVVLVGAYFLYNLLSKNYVENETPTEERQAIPAPDFTMSDMNGNKVNLSDFFGKPIVLNFWASWCPPCKSEMPHFNKVYEELKNDVVFIMLDAVDGKRETISDGKAFILDSGYTFPVYFDENSEASYIYGVSSLPSTLFINSDGNVINAYKGAINEKTLRGAITELLSK